MNDVRFESDSLGQVAFSLSLPVAAEAPTED